MASATVVVVGDSTSGDAPVLMVCGQGVKRQRQISPEAELGLLKLGRAIKYLAGENVYGGGRFKLTDPRVQAILLLLDKNREIYFSCPEVPTIGQRFRAWLNMRAA